MQWVNYQQNRSDSNRDDDREMIIIETPKTDDNGSNIDGSFNKAPSVDDDGSVINKKEAGARDNNNQELIII